MKKNEGVEELIKRLKRRIKDSHYSAYYLEHVEHETMKDNQTIIMEALCYILEEN